MRIAGRKLSEPNIEVLVIPRGGDQEDIVFKAKAVLDMDEFDKMNPGPTPPSKMLKGGKKVDDIDSPVFKRKQSDHAKKRIGFMIIKSLEATEGLEWETVRVDDPDTWGNYQDELKASGFSDIEVMRIIQTVMRANCLDEDRLEEARNAFLLSQEALNASSSSLDGQVSMPSGELASG